MAFSFDGRLLVSGGADRRVILWDFVGRQKLAELPQHRGSVFDLDFDPVGSSALAPTKAKSSPNTIPQGAAVDPNANLPSAPKKSFSSGTPLLTEAAVAAGEYLRRGAASIGRFPF